MELLVFDLDGTLLNSKQQITDYTRDTLKLLQQRNIAYTVATGRTLHAARDCLRDTHFPLLHVYNNGVVIWNPESTAYLHHNFLTPAEIDSVLEAFSTRSPSPFIFTVEPDGSHAVYHAPPQNELCQQYIARFENSDTITTKPLVALHSHAQITNINALGGQAEIAGIYDQLAEQSHLVVYTGGDMYRPNFHWLDIHHSASNKGGAISMLKASLGYERVICFGDSDNDESMFRMADEAYAPANALGEIKALATQVIGHHDEDGIARFLREYYSL